MAKEYIRDRSGILLGSSETQENGDIVAKGNAGASLIFSRQR